MTLGDEDASQQRIAVEDGINRFPAAVDLAPEESLTFYLTYEQEQTGPTGRITFTNDSDNRNVAIPIQGAESGAELVVMPSVVDFGRVRPEDDASQVILVSNVGQTRLDIESIEMNGSQDFSFEIAGVDPEKTQPSCLTPMEMANRVFFNSGFEITIKYATELAGPDEGELLIRSNSIAAVTTVPIRANSEEPCIQVTPDRIDFGAGLLGGFNPRPLTIQSCGMEPLRIDALRLEATADVFGIDPESLPQLPLRMPAADPALPASEFPTRNLVVHFTPEEEIAYGGSLVDSNDPHPDLGSPAERSRIPK